MADATCSGANTLFLPVEAIRESIKLLFSAYDNCTDDSDTCATKQSLARIFNQLVPNKSIRKSRGWADQQQRFLSLPKAGEKLEHHLSQPYQEKVAYTCHKVGPNAVCEYRQTLLNLVKELDRYTINRSTLGA